jgi:hypothetical protein
VRTTVKCNYNCAQVDLLARKAASTNSTVVIFPIEHHKLFSVDHELEWLYIAFFSRLSYLKDPDFFDHDHLLDDANTQEI